MMSRLLDQLAREPSRPAVQHAAHVNHCGKRREQWIKGATVAADETADERRPPRSLVITKKNGLRISRGSARVRVPSPEVSRARHQRRLALRENDNVTGKHLDLRFTGDTCEATAFREHVIRDEVLGARQDAWGKLGRSH